MAQGKKGLDSQQEKELNFNPEQSCHFNTGESDSSLGSLLLQITPCASKVEMQTEAR